MAKCQRTDGGFNEVDEPALAKHEELDALLADVETEAARLIREKLQRRVGLEPAERDVLASFFALLGIRLSSRLGDLDQAEARRGYEQLLPVLRATWKRRGEMWRRASEDVLLELNARTLLRAHRFVLAPKPAIPG